VHSPAGPIDVDDDGMMHHAVYDGGGDDRVAEIIPELAEPYIRCEQCGSFAVAAIDDLEEQGGVS